MTKKRKNAADIWSAGLRGNEPAPVVEENVAAQAAPASAGEEGDGETADSLPSAYDSGMRGKEQPAKKEAAKESVTPKGAKEPDKKDEGKEPRVHNKATKVEEDGEFVTVRLPKKVLAGLK